MSDAVIAALISGVVTLAGTITTVALSHKATVHAMEKRSEVTDQEIKGQIAVVNTKIETLSGRVERHNQVIERTYKLEQECAVLDEKIKVANKRIADLEGGQRHEGN